MKLLVVRKYRKESYTIGNLYVNGKYFCDTLEDRDRGLDSSMSEEEIRGRKVYGQTAIPTGNYPVVTQYWTKHKLYVPALKNVPGFSGILIHNGADQRDTSGCILVGRNTIPGKLTDSHLMMTSLTKLVRMAIKNKEEITITIDNWQDDGGSQG